MFTYVAPHVLVASTPADFAAAIDHAIATDTPEFQEARARMAVEYSWESRVEWSGVEEMARVMEERMGEP